MISAAPTTALTATVNAVDEPARRHDQPAGHQYGLLGPGRRDGPDPANGDRGGARHLPLPRRIGRRRLPLQRREQLSDSGAITIPQFAQFITSVGGTGVVTLDYGSGSPQEAAAELAYLDGSPTDTTSIGNGIEWNDTTGQWQTVNWGTVGYWAGLRGASPLADGRRAEFPADRLIRPPSPTSSIGRSATKNTEVGRSITTARRLPAASAPAPQHDPATYAAFAEQFASLAGEIQTTAGLPQISIGIDSGDPTGASDGNWTKNVLADGLADRLRARFHFRPQLHAGARR